MGNQRIIIIIIVFIFSNFSCNKNKTEEKKIEYIKSNYFDDKRIINDKFNVKFKGNLHSFAELELYYSYNDLKKEELLPYILIIVEKYKKYKHCTTAFNSYIEFYTGSKFEYDGSKMSLLRYLKNLNKLNKDQKNYLIYFLNLGLVNNDLASVKYLEILYRNGIGLKKNLIKADSLNNKLTQLEKSN